MKETHKEVNVQCLLLQLFATLQLLKLKCFSFPQISIADVVGKREAELVSIQGVRLDQITFPVSINFKLEQLRRSFRVTRLRISTLEWL